MKKILIVRTSPRKGGNSDILAQAFKDGASAAGNSVEEIRFADYKINYCKGCYGSHSKAACQNSGKCWQKDDMAELIPRLRDSDVVVFATPVYFYTLSAQMKTFLDRTVPLFGKQYKFRDIYLLATSESGSRSAMDATIKSLQGWIDCFPSTKIAGVVYGVGVLQAGDISSHQVVIDEAYQMGKNC